jgi:hypothetical protein
MLLLPNGLLAAAALRFAVRMGSILQSAFCCAAAAALRTCTHKTAVGQKI